ncbi:two-component system histidine kinase PnpS [Cytobacillus gottheilii]|uniref:histidine kinase n=1 Tax=Cytobacillus gottheilii TaxID=859144 RepID=A0ABX8F956_9BACI|nr:ATP-binding protein [Cytobacillus gottheilii]QVY60645.1 PAS domain-containing protein [Cytobacillus gottheilii]
MINFRSRLLFALITLIIAVLIFLGILLGQLFKTNSLQSFDERLQNESDLVKNYVDDQGGVNGLNDGKVKEMADALNVQITIANVNGSIVLESHDKNNVSRHEAIVEEITNGVYSSEDFLEIQGGFDLNYYWRPIGSSEDPDGYIILSTAITQVQDAYRQIWWTLTISLGAALFVIILLVTRITSNYTQPIESATKVAIELAKGNYRARTYEDPLNETSMLSNSINILARNLQEMVKSQEIQQDRIETLIENMGSGLVLIDSKGYINLINRSYKEIFEAKSSFYLHKLYYDVMNNNELTSMVEEVFMTEHKVRKQLMIPVGIERKHFDVSGVPIIGTNNVWKGVLLVFHDITELKKLEQMRKDFVANVSHELKTPITSIKGFSETLLDGAMEDKQALTDFLKIILQESDRLQSLIQDLLDLSKIEQQGFSLSKEIFDIQVMMKEVLAIMHGKLEEKDISLFFERQEAAVLMEGDPSRLKQVIINLLSNAISYTPQGGRVSLSVSEGPKKVHVKVQDTGIGIDQEEIPRIFERFYRVDKARSRNSGGTGLGLAIVKHIVEAHKGKISVTSDVGEGTAFHIELPKGKIEDHIQ